MHPLPCRVREFYRGPCLWVSPAVTRELSAAEPPLRAIEGCGTGFLRAPLRCKDPVHAPLLARMGKARACGARKDRFLRRFYGPRFAALDLLRSSRAKR